MSADPRPGLWVSNENSVTALLSTLREASLARLSEELGEVLPYLAEHFRDEQDPDGLFESLRETAPHVDSRLRELEAEHGAILDAGRNLLATVQACLRLRVAAERAREEFVASLKRHSETELNLLQDAYQLDLGK